MKGFIAILLLVPLAVGSPSPLVPVDCSDVYSSGLGHSGVYTLYPAGPTSPVQVHCDMSYEAGPDNRKWTVIQRRKDGSINFYRGWDQYRTGFGQASGEYWLGLENLHLLTRTKAYELRVDMEDFEGSRAFVRYSSFSVGPEHEGYKLLLGGSIDGGAGDCMRPHHDGMKFSTFDKDQDTMASVNCAQMYLGGWWYKECHHVNPNGLYMWGSSPYGLGINWQCWKGFTYSLKAFEMKIRPAQTSTK